MIGNRLVVALGAGAILAAVVIGLVYEVTRPRPEGLEASVQRMNSSFDAYKSSVDALIGASD